MARGTKYTSDAKTCWKPPVKKPHFNVRHRKAAEKASEDSPRTLPKRGMKKG